MTNTAQQIEPEISTIANSIPKDPKDPEKDGWIIFDGSSLYTGMLTS
jgi:hypothetical protein